MYNFTMREQEHLKQLTANFCFIYFTLSKSPFHLTFVEIIKLFTTWHSMEDANFKIHTKKLGYGFWSFEPCEQSTVDGKILASKEPIKMYGVISRLPCQMKTIFLLINDWDIHTCTLSPQIIQHMSHPFLLIFTFFHIKFKVTQKSPPPKLNFCF